MPDAETLEAIEVPDTQKTNPILKESDDLFGVPPLEEIPEVNTTNPENSVETSLTPMELVLLETLNPLWYLREINATHPSEIKEFTNICNYLKSHKTLSIPTEQLLRFNIHPTRSSLLAKLNRHRKVTVANNEMTFHYQTVTKQNLPNKISLMNETYSEMLNPDGESFTIYPSSHFTHFDNDTIVRLDIDKIGWKNMKSPQFDNKFIEIKFPSNILPPILITKGAYPLLQKIAIAKVIITLQKRAGEDANFFEERMEVDRKRLSLQYPRLFDFDFAQLNQGSTRLYREEFTAILVKKIFSNKNTTKMFLVDFDQEQNSQVLRHFPIENSENYDFLQSFYYLKEIFLNSDINNAIQLDDLHKMVFESTKLFVSFTEIRNEIFKLIPELPDEQFEVIMTKFHDKYLKKNNITGYPQIYSFRVRFYDLEETIFIHRMNMNSIINNSIEKLLETIPPKIVSQWADNIKKHHLSKEMFDESEFSAYLYQLALNEDSFFLKLYKNPNFRSIVKTLDKVTKYTAKLKVYTLDDFSNILGLRHDALYMQAYNSILKSKSPFMRFIFIIVNWFERKSIASTGSGNYKPEKNKSTIRDVDDRNNKQNEFLSFLGLSNIANLEKKCDKLWEDLPDSLNRRELNQNIQADLFSFFRNRDEVPVFSLDMIADRNLNRILDKGKHLKSYSKRILEYIKYQSYLTIFQHSSLRNKINLTIKTKTNSN